LLAAGVVARARYAVRVQAAHRTAWVSTHLTAAAASGSYFTASTVGLFASMTVPLPRGSHQLTGKSSRFTAGIGHFY
jgi:hypothetical protein